GSLIVNALLLFFILRKGERDVGNYRLLLMCFAINDLVFTVTHYVTYPVAETHPNMFLERSHGPLNSPFMHAIYIGNYGTSFPLLCAHFVYRAMALKMDFQHHFKKLLVGTVVAVAASYSVWFFVVYALFIQDDVSRVITKELMEGSFPSPIVHSNATAELYIGALYWSGDTFEGPRWRSFAGAAILVTIMSVVYGTITVCSYLIVSYLKTNAKSVSTLRLQRQLFKCLTVFPMITAYFPAGFCIFAPILGISWTPISMILPNFCCLHPLFDGLVVMLAIPGYR
ncbi:hypothetical protein PFISCL1PPCAC_18185, partial [Pristionchus fissidentatus]